MSKIKKKEIFLRTGELKLYGIVPTTFKMLMKWPISIRVLLNRGTENGTENGTEWKME